MKKTRFLLLIIITINSIFLNGQSLSYQWGGSFRAIGNSDGVAIIQTEADSTGNLYCLVATGGNVDLNPFSATFPYSVTTSQGLALVKMSSQGTFLWAKTWDSLAYTVKTNSFVIDKNGNLIIAGVFSETHDFDPGSGTSNLTPSQLDGYVLKLDSNGNFVWVKQITSTHIEINDIAIDSDNNLYLTGNFNISADFDPGISTVNKIVTRNSTFLLELDNNGIFERVDILNVAGTGNGYNLGRVINVDKNKNIILTGDFNGSMDLDVSSNTNIITAISTYRDHYLIKLDSNRNHLWNLTEQHSSGFPSNKIFKSHFDQFGNIYTIGTTSDSIYLDRLNNTQLHVSTGGPDIYLRKLNPNGNLIWANTLSSGYGKELFDLKIDRGGNVYVAGLFNRSLSFGPFTRTTIRNGTISYPYDHFLTRINSNGSFDWVDQLVTGYLYLAAGPTFTIDSNDVVYSVGTIIGAPGGGTTMDINPSPTASFNVTASYLKYTGYVRKLGQCAERRTDSITSCGAFTWIDGISYSNSTNSPNFRIQGATSNGCDSVITLNLTVTNGNVSTTDTIVACNQFTWIDGNLYSVSNNNATFTFSNARPNGCDSIVTLNLTINNTIRDTVSINACRNYTWAVNNTNYNLSGIYLDTLSSASGCDSINVLDLTIDTVNLRVTQSGLTLTANQTGAIYQWLDCTNGSSPITGEINQSYTATANGDYAVEVTENACVDTSVCVSIISVGVIESNFGAEFNLFPNPTNGNFSIDLGENYSSINVTITDINGRLIQLNKYSNSQLLKLKIVDSAGVYQLIVESEDKKAVIRLIKN